MEDKGQPIVEDTATADNMKSDQWLLQKAGEMYKQSTDYMDISAENTFKRKTARVGAGQRDLFNPEPG